MQWNFSMVEASRPEPAIDEEKLKFFIFKIAIWDYFDNYEATYMAFPVDEKSRLLTNTILSYLKSIMVQVNLIFLLFFLSFGLCSYLLVSELFWCFVSPSFMIKK